MWKRKRKPSIIFCHLIVYLRLLLSHALVFLHSVHHFSLGDYFYFAIDCIMLLVGCVMLCYCVDFGLLFGRWLNSIFRLWRTSHAELLPTHASVPGNTQNKHLTKGHTSQTFDKLIDAVQFFFVFRYSSVPAPRCSHASLLFNGSHCANPIPSVDWWMLMWLFFSFAHSFSISIKFISTQPFAREITKTSAIWHTFHFSCMFTTVNNPGKLIFFPQQSAKCELRW